MQFLSIMAVIGVFILCLVMGTGTLDTSFLSVYVDFASLLLLLLLCIPILVSANAMKDFFAGISMAVGKKKNSSIIQIKRALQAVKLVIRSLWTGCVFIAVISGVIVLRALDNLAWLPLSLAVLLLPVIYAVGIILLLLPVNTKLELLLLDALHQDSDTVPHSTKAE